MKQAALVIIKPDGVSKDLVGAVFNKFSQANLELIALKTVKATREQAMKHYQQLSDKPFYEEIISYLTGKFHKKKELVIVIYYGDDAIKKCRKIAGATDPERAHPESIRGAYGRITTKGLYENVVHVSSDTAEAKREIKLWFEPQDLTRNLYPAKKKSLHIQKKVWA
jgi:nucleoside-diphosphate kinase